MSAFSTACRICGHNFTFPEGCASWDCPACGASHGRPRAQGELLDKLRRANIQRAGCDYVNAEADYRRVLSDHPDEHEALWGLVLCKYGVEYVLDARQQERRAVLHFLRRKPITEDMDFCLACARAPVDISSEYQKDAAYIEQIQEELLRLEGDEGQYDIFLCYKGSAMNGPGFAREYDHARDLYYNLRETGYRVFFAHETLKQAAGANYEARICHALHSAKVMLVICSDPASLRTPWVHSEWSRYLERVDGGEECRLIPLLYDGCDPYALPDEFVKRVLQALRMDELTSLDSLRANLQKNLSAAPAAKAVAADDAEALLPIEYALANQEWDEASRLAVALIKKRPRCAMAYLYRLMARHHMCAEDMLRQQIFPFEEDLDWQWALRHASGQEQARLTAILEESMAVRRRKEAEKQEAERQRQAAERQRREEAERWTALQADFRAAAQAGKWHEASQRAEKMIAQRPQNHMGYLKRLLSAHELVEPAQLAECETAYERENDWQEALARASEQDQKMMASWLEASHAYRKKQERARRAAERKRKAEEEQRAEAARREWQRRVAEEERAEAQRIEEERKWQQEQERQQAVNRRENVFRLLEKHEWDAAREAVLNLPEDDEKTLLQLMAKYCIAKKEDLARCKAPFYQDVLWLRLQKLDEWDLEDLLEDADLTAIRRHIRMQKALKSIALFAALAAFMYGVVALEHTVPEKQYLTMLLAAMIGFLLSYANLWR